MGGSESSSGAYNSGQQVAAVTQVGMVLTPEGGAEGVSLARSLASDVSQATGGNLQELAQGFSVTVPHGARGILVRIMEQGGGRTNYYRVVIPGKQAFTVTGDVSTDAALTHISIADTSLQDILNIIARIKG